MTRRYKVNYGLCWSLINPLDINDNPFSIPIGSIVSYVGERRIKGQDIVYLTMNGIDFWITKQNFDFALQELIS